MKKIWFIEIDKIFQETNLRIFYLPMTSLIKLMISEQFGKVPDPMLYLAGFTLMPKHNSQIEIVKPKDLMFLQKKNEVLNNKQKNM